MFTDEKPVGDGNAGNKPIPVYVSKMFTGSLYLIQHTLKPALSSSANAHIDYSDVKFKSGFDKFSFKVPLDQDSPCYDKIKSDNLAGRLIGSTGEKEVPPRISDVTYEGKGVPYAESGSNYVIAVLKDKALHLCPLKGIVQVKPVFSYLNKTESRKLGGGEGNADTETEDEEEATKVTVKFARTSKERLSETASAFRSKNAGSAFKEEEEAPWTNMNFQRYAPENVDLLKCSNVNQEKRFDPVDPKLYLDKLFPKYVEPVYAAAAEKKSAQPPGKISISQLKQMSLKDQIKTLMIQGNVLKYKEIQDFLRTKLKASVEDGDLTRQLLMSAYVVQGCWVVRSDALYPENYVSSARGVSREVMIEARDFILRKFTEKRLVERKTLSHTLKLPVEEITEILRPIAKAVPKQGYEFIYPFDSDFASNFQSVLERQAVMWQQKGVEQRNRKISGGDSGPSQRRRSRTKSMSSDTDSGAESDVRNRRQRHSSTRSDASATSKKES